MEADKISTKDKLALGLSLAAYLLFAVILVSSFTKIKIFKGKYFTPRVMMVFYHPRFGVYTRKPGEPIHNIYKIVDGHPVLMDLRPFQQQYQFGLNRDYKVVAAEVEAITSDSTLFVDAPAVATHPYQMVTDFAVGASTNWRVIENKNVHFLSGRYILTLERPLFWKNRADTSAYTIHYLPVNIISNP